MYSIAGVQYVWKLLITVFKYLQGTIKNDSSAHFIM